MRMGATTWLEALGLIPSPKLLIVRTAVRLKNDTPCGNVLISMNSTRRIYDESRAKTFGSVLIPPHEPYTDHGRGVSHITF